MTRPNPIKAQVQIREWNEKHPIGTTVDVTRDDGSITETKTASEAWVMASNIAVIKLEGISGCYSLNRVHVIP